MKSGGESAVFLLFLYQAESKENKTKYGFCMRSFDMQCSESTPSEDLERLIGSESSIA